MNLPKEAWYNIFLNYTYKELINHCKINRTTRNLCQDNGFWKLWLNQKYGLNFRAQNLIFKEIASNLDRLFKVFKLRKTAMSRRAIKNILSYEDAGKLLLDNLSNPINGFTSLMDLDSVGMEHTLGNLRLNVIEGDNMDDNNQLTNVGEENYNIFIKTIMIPTTYLINDNKAITIDFDIDLARYLMFDFDDAFIDYFLTENINVLNKAFYIRYVL